METKANYYNIEYTYRYAKTNLLLFIAKVRLKRIYLALLVVLYKQTVITERIASYCRGA